MRELGLNPSDAELRDLVNEADLNHDGVISFDGRQRPPWTTHDAACGRLTQ
jgi:Ca2+-binding EF-hand superfamily protein